MMVEILRFQAQPVQRLWLSSPADIAVYGGAAGGGKTWSLLYKPISAKHHLVPGFRGVIFRRTYPQITVAGGLWDESLQVYPHFGGVPKYGDLEWVFPSGATIAFHHLQHEKDKDQWQGAQVAYFGFDELSHFTETQFAYVALSRGRSMSGIRPYVRATTNPDPGWVKAFLAPWVDKEFAGRAKSGEIRHFVRDGAALKWVPTGTADSKSLTFVRASVYDNKEMLRVNPEYVANLKALLPVDRARLLDGDWDVRREGLVYPEFELCVVDSLSDALAGRPAEVGGMDFGFNHPFAAVWGHLDDDVLWITGCRYVRQCTLPTHSESLPKGVAWWCDPSQPGSIAELRIAGHSAMPCVHQSARGAGGEVKKPLLAGIDRVTERIRTGRLKILRSACAPLIREMGMYQYDPEKRSEDPIKENDDACDALRYLITGLDRRRAIPVSIAPEPEAPKPVVHEDDDRWYGGIW